MPAILQRSFAGGEVAPALYGRADQTKFQTGLRACRNFFVQRFGGVANRPGTGWVCEVKDSTKRHRLLKFVFNADQTYILIFGDQNLRVIRDGAQLESAPSTPYELATPYVEADLPDLNIVQSGDVVTICHPSYAPRQLARTGHTSWTLTAVAFSPQISRPAACTATAGGAGTKTFRYRITAISDDNGEESLPGVQAAVTITGATQANPCVITAAAHGYANGDDVLIEAVVGMTELNGKVYRIANKAANTFELQGIDATGYTAYGSGGTAKRVGVTLGSAATPTDAAPHVISWTAVTGAREYNIYKASNGIYGYIGTAESTSFDDINIDPATAYTPPQESDVFTAAGDWPALATYFQERQGFASTDDEPERVWFSRTGAYTNFTTSSPIQDDDSISFQLAGRQVNEVRHMVEIGGKLVILTSGSEITIEGDTDGVLRPTAINPRVRGYNGAALQPPPLVVTDSLLYIQARGTIARDLLLDGDGIYKNRDLTIFAPHLFEGYTITAWDFAQIPHSIGWAVRSDGTMIGLTYLREHEVSGWHRHDTGDGDLFEDVAAVPEGDEDAVYVIVKRTINGATKRYVERFATRRISDIAEANFLDSSLAYDGTNATATTLTLSGGTTWSNTEDLTLTASASIFVAGDVGNRYVIDNGDDTVTVEVLAYTSGTVVTVRAIANVPTSLRATARATWAKAVDQISGLGHLEGRTVGVLGDGNVVANGLEDDPIVVTAGAITLPRPYVKIRVGLPIVAEIQTLDIDIPEGGTLIERKKRINRVNLLVESSRGIRAGTTGSSANLREFKQRTTEAMGEPTALRTGVVEIPITAEWTNGGSVIVRQNDPLPLTILSIAPGGDVGG
jgi:hypothetical protein